MRYRNIKVKLKEFGISKIKLQKINLNKIDFNKIKLNKIELNIIKENPIIKLNKTKLNRTNLSKIKLKKFRQSRDSKALLVYLLLFVISIGFAAISRNLNITGSSFLKGQKFDVHFENVQVSSEGVQIEEPEIIDNTTLEYNITLDKPGDFVEFTVDAKNDGTIDAMVSTFDEIKVYEGDSETPLDSIPDYLDYSVTYAENEDIHIRENHLLKSGKKVTYKIHVEYKREIEEDQIVSTQQTLRSMFFVSFAKADKNAISISGHETTESTLSKDYFKDFGSSHSPKEVIFLNTGVSDSDDSKYTDISEEQDGSILAWMNEDTMCVSAMETDLYVKAPTDLSYLLGEDKYYGWFTQLKKIDLSKLDTSCATNMSYMFYNTGYSARAFEIVGLNELDTSSVTDMSYMFYQTGYSAETFKVEGLNSWNTSSVTNMSYMFRSAGNLAPFKLDISAWNTSKVTDMSYMFLYAGINSTTFELNLSNWDTSSVTNMQSMFSSAGYSATTWNVGDISGWDTSKVIKMSYMFDHAGYSADYSLVLSGWEVRNVTAHSDFNSGVTNKVTPPNWSN